LSLEESELASLRARVSKLEGQLKFLYEKLNIEIGPEIHAPDDPQVVELIMQGKKIEAITMDRQTTRAGLAEAKNAVEEIQSRLGL
jgi:ribosomal protein L7/L12